MHQEALKRWLDDGEQCTKWEHLQRLSVDMRVFPIDRKLAEINKQRETLNNVWSSEDEARVIMNVISQSLYRVELLLEENFLEDAQMSEEDEEALKQVTEAEITAFLNTIKAYEALRPVVDDEAFLALSDVISIYMVTYEHLRHCLED